MRSNCYGTLSILIFWFLGGVASANPKGLNVSGQIILTENGSPVNSTNVQFKLKVLSPSGCILYSETHSNVDLSSTAGSFNLVLGMGSGAMNAYSSGSPQSASALRQIFDNSAGSVGSLSGGNSSECTSGTYSPAVSDMRKVRVEFDTNNGDGLQIVEPDFTVRNIPYALLAQEAEDAKKLGGKPASSYLETSQLAANETDPTVQTFAKSGLPTCAANEVLKSDGTNFICVSDQTGGSPAVATTSSTGIVQVGGGLAVDGSGILSVDYNTVKSNISYSIGDLKTGLGASQFPDATCSADKTLTWSSVTDTFNCTSISISSTAVSDFGTAVDARIAADSALVRNPVAADIDVNQKNLANTGYITMYGGKSFHLSNNTSDPAGLVAADKGKMWYRSDLNEVRYWNGTAAVTLGAAGAGLQSLNGLTDNTQTFAVDGSGTDVAINSASGVHTFSIPSASATNRGVLTSADWSTFNNKLGTSSSFSGDVSGNYNSMSVDKIKGTAISATAPTSGQLLVYDGTTQYSPVSISGDASISTSGALTVNNVRVDRISSATGQYLSYMPNNVACANNEVLKWNGTGWVCGTDNAGAGTVTGVTASAPLASSGGATPDISLANGTASGQTLRWNGTNWVAAQLSNSDVTGLGSLATKNAVDLGSADTTGTLDAARLPALTGDVTSSAGSAATTLSNTGVTAGTYSKVTVDAKGRVTSATDIGSTDVTTALGFTPLNKAGDVMAGLLGLNGVASDPAGLVAGDKGKMWYRTDTNEIKYWNGTAAVALGVSGAGLQSLNGLTDSSQTFAINSTGTDVAINSGSGVHTISIPSASATNRGVLTSADWSTFNNKLGTSSSFSGDVSGNYNSMSVDKIKGTAVSATAPTSGQMLVYDGTTQYSPVSMSGDATMSNAGALTLANSGVIAGTYSKVTVDAKGRVTTGASLAASDIPVLDWSKITSGLPTNLSGYGITDAVANGGGTPSIQTGTFAARPAFGTAGRLYIASDNNTLYRDTGAAWVAIGDGTGAGGTVSSVTSANTDIAVATTTTTPVLTLNSGTAGGAGDADKIAKLDGTGLLASGMIPSLDAAKITTGTLPIARGGTNSTTALNNNRVMVSNSGAIVEGAAITANRALVSDANGIPTHSAVTDTELGYLAGTTSSVQTQLNGMAQLAGRTSGQNLRGGTAASENLTLDSTSDVVKGYVLLNPTGGNVGVGTTTPAIKLDVAGAVRVGTDATACAAGVAGAIRYNGGNVEYCNGTAWTAFAASGSGITSLNGLTGNTQTFATPGTSGTDPNWSSSGSAHTLNIPLASAVGVNSGLISKTDYDAFNSKLGTGTSFSGDVSGNYNSLSVDKIKGTAVTITSLTNKDYLKYNGTAWVNSAIDAATDLSGILPVANGGTGANSLASGNLLIGGGTGAVTTLAAGGAGNILYGTGLSSWASGSADTAGLVDKSSTQTISGAKAFTNYVQMSQQNAVRFADSDSTNYVAIRSPATVAADVTLTLPDTAGSNGQVLTTNGSGALSWSTPSTGGGALSTLTAASATNSIDNTNYAQTWNWSTATTQSPMTMTANAITTGSILSLTSSSTNNTGTSGLLYVANTSATTTGTVARIQSNSNAGSGLTLLGNGNMGIGTTSPNQLLTVEGVTSLRETTPPSGTTNYGKLYVKSSDSKLYFMDDSGLETQLGASSNSNSGTAIGIRGTAIFNSSGSNYVITWPTGTIEGDTALICGGHGYAINLPVGWANLDNQSGFLWAGACFSKTLDATDITNGSVNVSTTGSYDGTFAIVTFAGSATVRNTVASRNSSGSSTVNLSTDSSPQTTDALIYFGSNRGNSTNTVSNGTLQRQSSNTNSSSVLNIGSASSPGTQSATFSYSPTGLANYQAIIAVIPPAYTTLLANELKFTESKGAGNNFVSLKAPDYITLDTIWTLPAADGTANQVLTTNGSGILSWSTPAAAGITSLGGESGAAQSLAIGTSGTAPNWNSASNTHTINIPMASTVGATAGLISKADYDSFAAKQSAGNYITDLTGDITASGPGSASATIANNAITDAKVSTSAAISRSKIATGSANAVVINDGSGNFSSEAQLAVSRGGTGASNFTADRLIASNGTGSALTTFTCAVGKYLSFDATGVMICANNPASSAFVDGGNSFTAAATLGTNDAYALNLETNNTTRMTLDSSGKVGIGTTSPRGGLDVNSTVLLKPSVNNGTATIDFGSGNLQHTSSDCGAFILHNMKDGGAYTFAVKGANSTTCSFTAYSDAGTTAITVHLPTDHGATTASKHTLYSFVVMGTDVYVSWMPGM